MAQIGVPRFHIIQIESQNMNIKEAEKAVQLVESLYTNGKATQLEVLDAQLALENARTNLAKALYDAKNSETSLSKSLGLLDGFHKKQGRD